MPQERQAKNRIDEIRKKHGLSVSAFCKEVGMCRKTYYNYCNRTTPIASDKLIKISKCFDVSSDYLLGLCDHTAICITDREHRVLGIIENNKAVEHKEIEITFFAVKE